MRVSGQMPLPIFARLTGDLTWSPEDVRCPGSRSLTRSGVDRTGESEKFLWKLTGRFCTFWGSRSVQAGSTWRFGAPFEQISRKKWGDRQ
nr:hypothetical protein JVH1_7404 [Rhodococcus sp. JVH1]